ncbi:MAG: hypothetical protein CL678_15505 [Bdellovibrionaceae bacterium]|nr:hypothetical protein [Pseudobdellovibrionaceae bacterium]
MTTDTFDDQLFLGVRTSVGTNIRFQGVGVVQQRGHSVVAVANTGSCDQGSQVGRVTVGTDRARSGDRRTQVNGVTLFLDGRAQQQATGTQVGVGATSFQIVADNSHGLDGANLSLTGTAVGGNFHAVGVEQATNGQVVGEQGNRASFNVGVAGNLGAQAQGVASSDHGFQNGGSSTGNSFGIASDLQSVGAEVQNHLAIVAFNGLDESTARQASSFELDHFGGRGTANIAVQLNVDRFQTNAAVQGVQGVGNGRTNQARILGNAQQVDFFAHGQRSGRYFSAVDHVDSRGNQGFVDEVFGVGVVNQAIRNHGGGFVGQDGVITVRTDQVAEFEIGHFTGGVVTNFFVDVELANAQVQTDLVGRQGHGAEEGFAEGILANGSQVVHDGHRQEVAQLLLGERFQCRQGSGAIVQRTSDAEVVRLNNSDTFGGDGAHASQSALSVLDRATGSHSHHAGDFQLNGVQLIETGRFQGDAQLLTDVVRQTNEFGHLSIADAFHGDQGFGMTVGDAEATAVRHNRGNSRQCCASASRRVLILHYSRHTMNPYDVSGECAN